LNVNLALVGRALSSRDIAGALETINGRNCCRFAHADAAAELDLGQAIFHP
jgi:hypothetical protein